MGIKSTSRTPPAEGQESVWDYPRPPRLESSGRRIRIVFGGVTVVDTSEACRVLETSHPPTWYVPPHSVLPDILQPAEGGSFCEFKGRAVYWTLRVGGEESRNAAWSYPQPRAAFSAIRNYLSFYPSRVAACFVDDFLVQAQAGDFYGGWITPDIVGPFKGGEGTVGW